MIPDSDDPPFGRVRRRLAALIEDIQSIREPNLPGVTANGQWSDERMNASTSLVGAHRLGYRALPAVRRTFTGT
jgi:hypothetical protein